MYVQLTDIISDSCKFLCDPSKIRLFHLDKKNYNPDPVYKFSLDWDDIGLAYGYPGFILLFSALTHANIFGDTSSITHAYILALKEALENRKNYLSSSLFSGISGISFALRMAAKNKGDYQKFLSKLDQYLLKDVRDNFIKPIRRNVSINKPSSSVLWDVISGLCGIGRYLLFALSFEPEIFRPFLTELIETILLFCRPISVGKHEVPGWFLSKDDLINHDIATSNTKGNFNLGYAHGTPGILAFLSLCSMSNIDVSNQKETIAKITQWVEQKSVQRNFQTVWSYTVSYEEEVGLANIGSSVSGFRDAWCYGTPGVSRALFLAGKALNDDLLKTRAIKSFDEIFTRSPEVWNIPGTGLCHGIAGLLLITFEMAKEKECLHLKEKVEFLKMLLLNQYSSQNSFGFQEIELTKSKALFKINKPGFLEGACGVLLTLLYCEGLIDSSHVSLPLLLS